MDMWVVTNNVHEYLFMYKFLCKHMLLILVSIFWSCNSLFLFFNVSLPKWLYYFTFPPAMHENSNFPTSLPRLTVCHFDAQLGISWVFPGHAHRPVHTPGLLDSQAFVELCKIPTNILFPNLFLFHVFVQLLVCPIWNHTALGSYNVIKKKIKKQNTTHYF